MEKIIATFQHALKQGTGKAFLMFQENPGIDFSDAIYKACITNFSYHPQFEPRGQYLYELLCLLPEKQKSIIEDDILNILSKRDQFDDNTDQMASLAKHFYKNGNYRAKEILYEAFAKAYHFGAYDDFILDYIIEATGLEGLFYITDILGADLDETEIHLSNDWLIAITEELYPDIDPLKELEIQANWNPNIRRYLKVYQANLKHHRDKNFSYNFTHKSVKKLIDTPKKAIQLRTVIAKSLPENDFIQLSQDYKKENDEKRILCYLKIFERRKYPFDFQDILPYTHSDDAEIVSTATYALRYFKHKVLREYALTNLKKGINVYDNLAVLSNNFQEEDTRLIETILHDVEDIDELQSRAWGIFYLFDKNRTKASLPSLIQVYRKGYQSTCRREVVKLMIENGILPDWIAKEAIYDCNFETREMISKHPLA